MNGRVRLLLCAVCVVIGAFQAPMAMHVFAQDLTGPYEGGRDPRATAVAAAQRADTNALAAARRTTPLPIDPRVQARTRHDSDGGTARARGSTGRR